MTDLRRHFPALAGGFAFLDNAAGAQVPRRCIEAISGYLSAGSCNVGMPYPASKAATELKARARAATAEYLNCRPGEVAIGTSSTALSFLLARAFSRMWGAGDEVVISELEHEANASPWRDLGRQGVGVKVWRARWPEGRLSLDDLRALVGPRTRLVALTSAANSTGSTPDVAGAAGIARKAGAWTFADLVHSAPHLLPDVARLGVDFAVFSTYKVFGPHAGFLFIREGLLERLPADKLHFVPDDSLQKFEPGTANHEALAGWLGSLDYLRHDVGDGAPGRAGLEAAYRRIEALERPLVAYLLKDLPRVPGLRLYGEPGLEGRVGTFCFNLAGQPPMQVAERLAAAGVGVAAGHYYATMPMTALGCMPDGAVRASLAHYNTRTELETLVNALISQADG